MLSRPIALENLHMDYRSYEEQYHEDSLGWNVDSLDWWSARYPYHWWIRRTLDSGLASVS
jgi:hypothetical protein